MSKELYSVELQTEIDDFRATLNKFESIIAQHQVYLDAEDLRMLAQPLRDGKMILVNRISQAGHHLKEPLDLQLLSNPSTPSR